MGAAADWIPPVSFDEYRLVKALGRGGMGQVWLAHDALLDRMVAVKFISGFVDSDSARQRFITEARAAARVQHPNIITVHRIGELGPRPYLISEFVRGDSLDKMERPVPWRRTLEIAVGLARGLAAAHRRGVLHRDLKPANAIISDSGEVKILDFGLAKFFETAFRDHDEPRPPVTAGTAPPTPTAAPAADSASAPVDPPFLGTQWPGTSPVASPTPARAEVTVAGAVMGTPMYMSPEAWRGDPATPRSDIYSLGALLYELCTGGPPHRAENATTLRELVLHVDAAPLLSRTPGVDARFAEIVDRCLRRLSAERFASGEELRDALEATASGRTSGDLPAGNPYRGLSAFEAEHRRLFFGRDGAIRTVLERLTVDPFVLVAGESGVGKSSLCRAGVLPRVVEGTLGDRRFQVLRVVPGRWPKTVLTAALAPLAGVAEVELAAFIASDPDEVVHRIRARLGADGGLLLFIDQFEELVTLASVRAAEQVTRLIASLVVRSPQLRVLATVRGDYIARLTRLAPIAGEIERALLLLPPLGPEAIREAVIGPAKATGVRFENDGLVDELVAAADGGSLPLLQFALSELWEARDRATETITAASLDALGGVAGALSLHADAAIAALLPNVRTAARGVLLSLITSDRTRARRSEAEVAGTPETRAAVEALVRARLVVAREDEGSTAYEIAHETMIDGWPTLRAWLHQDADGRVIEARIAKAAAEWDRLGRPRDALWGKRQLDEAQAVPVGELPPAARAFVARSHAAVRRRGWLIVGAPAVVVLAAIGGYLAVRGDQERTQDRRVAAHVVEADREISRAAQVAAKVDALRTSAFAGFDRSDSARAEEEWAEAIRLQAEVDHARTAASQALEAALIVDAGRGDVRDRLAEMLYLRALDAERWHRPTDELIQRLRLHDRSGAYLRQWDAPARLSVSTLPPSNARVELLRYDSDQRGLRHAVPVRDLGRVPVAPIELPGGSYLLRLTLDAGRSQPYPVLLGRGEAVSIRAPMPPPRIPGGFAFVPSGRMLYGSDVEEVLRKAFLSTHPEHVRSVESFLIAIHETTYTEWIEFLEALSAQERERRRPKGATFDRGSVELQRDSTGWSLTLQPSTRSYTASSDALISYPGRKVRASQPWLQMPVSGVSLDDARAYVQWLANSGRVARARLCTELEWERAARGADNRRYPHGMVLGPDEANIDETYGREPFGFGPDAVGSYPASISVFGVLDLAGNVWEWVESAEGFHLRGGAYYFDGSLTAQSINRVVAEPTMRDLTVGVRVCADSER